MKQGKPERVTSLTFTQYDPANYALDHAEGIKLSTINKILLGLFNNDLYVYTLLVGKMKGLWWKYWFADSAVKGYAAGDMICSNGIQEIGFLKKYWSSIKEIADYGSVMNKLPRFDPNDEEVVAKYMAALSDYFHLGNRGLERQVYISLKDNNKDVVTITNSWQPYIVTAEELQRREYQMSDILEDGIRKHNVIYHFGLDVLDEADSEYEIEGTGKSVYDGDIAKYLPKVRLADEEHESWVNFAATCKGSSDKILGLGTVAYDFIHIVKPLGTAVHFLETWVRTDGHVTVKGYIPVAMLTEVIPEEGSLAYTKWKMGGNRCYGMRLDYAINDAISKLYFQSAEEDVSSEVSETVTDLISGQAMIRAAKRMIEEQDDDVTDSLYSILSYNPPYSGVVGFYPKSCDFPFEDLPNHPELLKEGDDEILRDLLDGDKYTHTFEPIERDGQEDDVDHPSPVDVDTLECHLFRKKNTMVEIPVDPIPSPVERADDTDTVASDLRLLRNFGTTRSPAMKEILGASIIPDAGELVLPSFDSPTIATTKWTWIAGQSILFEVPANTQNIQFEVEGMMRDGIIDFSLYDICKQDGNNLAWVHDLVMNYDFPKAILKSALAEGFESEQGLPQLINNMDGMMTRIENCVLNHSTFIPFMQFRSMDISPLNILLTQLRSGANEYVKDEDPEGTLEFQKAAKIILKLHGYLYEYIAEDFRYGALHDCFAELLSNAVSLNASRMVLLHQLKKFLIGKQIARPDLLGQEYNPQTVYEVDEYCLHAGNLYRCTTKTTAGESFTPSHWEVVNFDDRCELWIITVNDAIESAENGISSLVKAGHDELSRQLSSLKERVKNAHEKYVNERNLEFTDLSNFPNNPTEDEYTDELTKYKEKYMENFRDIYSYLEEVDDNLQTSQELKTKIQNYLAVDWLDESTRSYLVYQLTKLNDSTKRYKKQSLNICLGYDKYVVKWMDIFDIDGGTELHKDEVGYTLNDLLHGTGGRRSLTTIKAKLEEDE